MDFISDFSFAFWAILCVGSLIVMACTEIDDTEAAFGWTTVCFAATIGLLIWLSEVNAFSWLVANGKTVVYWGAAYLGVGVVWGVAKWFFYLMRVRDKLVEYRAQNDITGAMTLEQQTAFRRANYISSPSIPPEVKDSKGRVIFWMIYWPFSAPWTLINEPVARFFNFVYNRIAGMLQGMSDRLFKDLA